MIITDPMSTALWGLKYKCQINKFSNSFPQDMTLCGLGDNFAE